MKNPREGQNWTQEGVFLDIDGAPVRAYDDVVLLEPAKPEADEASPYTIPAGTTATVLFFQTDPNGCADLEHYWPEGSFGFTTVKLSTLRLHMTNEQKYPR